MHDIGITGNDDSISSLLASLVAESTQNIISFITVQLIDGDVEGLHQLPYPSQLVDQLIRSRRAVGFIVLKELMSEGRGCPVEGDGVVSWF